MENDEGTNTNATNGFEKLYRAMRLDKSNIFNKSHVNVDKTSVCKSNLGNEYIQQVSRQN